MNTFLVVETGNVVSIEYECTCGCKRMLKSDRTEFKRVDTGETTLKGPHSFGPGAMYWEDQYTYEGRHRDWDNDTGKHLVVVCPDNHSWDIDSRSSNCALPNDRTHRCWVRHGEPPVITVDKQGHTCAAGAGSIQTSNYHGHLFEGRFTP